VSNSPDPPSRPPRFEDLRVRAERALLDALSLFAEFRATLEELDRVRLMERTPAAGEEHDEQPADQAGDGKATPP
jgi:hypothetical protein